MSAEDSAKKKILIVEDQPIIAADLSGYMKDFGYQPLPSVKSAEDALLLLENIQVDCVLIDINIEGDMDGVELAHQIKETYGIPMIFITALHDDHTIKRITSSGASAYLVKPVSEYSLRASIELALHKEERVHSPKLKVEKEHEDFYIKYKNQLRRISAEEVNVCEAYDNYVYLHTNEGKFLIHSSLKAVAEKLVPFDFMRVHRSYIVNMKSIDSLEGDDILINGLRIRIGKTYREEFMSQIRLL
jgi:DNA-binding LytR/AlgR family response regulator